jgi:hypothetical protein
MEIEDRVAYWPIVYIGHLPGGPCADVIGSKVWTTVLPCTWLYECEDSGKYPVASEFQVEEGSHNMQSN